MASKRAVSAKARSRSGLRASRRELLRWMISRELARRRLVTPPRAWRFASPHHRHADALSAGARALPPRGTRGPDLSSACRECEDRSHRPSFPDGRFESVTGQSFRSAIEPRLRHDSSHWRVRLPTPRRPDWRRVSERRSLERGGGDRRPGYGAAAGTRWCAVAPDPLGRATLTLNAARNLAASARSRSVQVGVAGRPGVASRAVDEWPEAPKLCFSMKEVRIQVATARKNFAKVLARAAKSGERIKVVRYRHHARGYRSRSGPRAPGRVRGPDEGTSQEEGERLDEEHAPSRQQEDREPPDPADRALEQGARLPRRRRHESRSTSHPGGLSCARPDGTRPDVRKSFVAVSLALTLCAGSV